MSNSDGPAPNLPVSSNIGVANLCGIFVVHTLYGSQSSSASELCMMGRGMLMEKDPGRSHVTVSILALDQ